VDAMTKSKMPQTVFIAHLVGLHEKRLGES